MVCDLPHPAEQKCSCRAERFEFSSINKASHAEGKVSLVPEHNITLLSEQREKLVNSAGGNELLVQ